MEFEIKTQAFCIKDLDWKENYFKTETGNKISRWEYLELCDKPLNKNINA